MKGFTIGCLFCAAVFTGCLQAPKPPPKTQLELREIQSRTYEGKDLKLVMRAVIGALQDEGYIIRNADKELGFINASKEADVSDPNDILVKEIFMGAEATWEKNSIIEASATVGEFGEEVRVRMLFQAKVMNNFGNPVRTETIEDPAFYQSFFSKVDKSVFFEHQGL